MKEIIEKLENRIKAEYFKVVETFSDDFSYLKAIETSKGFYVVYTTKGFRKYTKDCLMVVFLSEYIPFSSITPFEGGDIISPYLRKVFQNKKSIIYYESYFSVDDVIELLKS